MHQNINYRKDYKYILSYVVEMKNGSAPAFPARKPVRNKEAALLLCRTLSRKSYRPDATVEYLNFRLYTNDMREIPFALQDNTQI